MLSSSITMSVPQRNSASISPLGLHRHVNLPPNFAARAATGPVSANWQLPGVHQLVYGLWRYRGEGQRVRQMIRGSIL